jgi:hypothetical protein
MIKKKGQGGSGAAVLVAIIAGLIVLYILFLEPAERDELLNTASSEDSAFGNSNGKNITNVLEEEPGRLDYLKGDNFEISLPSFNLYKTTNAEVIDNFNAFAIRNGWFDKKNAEKIFEINNLDNTEDVLLTFITRKHSGTLSINLNGKNIYENSIRTQNTEPIGLKKSNLNEGQNTLTFTVSGIGGAFWKTNEYIFENMKVIGDVTDVSKQKTKNVFTVEPWKYNNLEKATVRFNPNCKQKEVGVLDIKINDRNVFSGIPDCGMLNRYDIPLGTIDAGINDVVFTTNKGSYLVDLIKIKLELEELSSPLYWFDISDDHMENITEGISEVNLTLEFVDDDEDKVLDLNVNGHMRRIDQDEATYTKQINSWVEEGRNYIKLIPKRSSVDIVSLTVDLIEKDDND